MTPRLALLLCALSLAARASCEQAPSADSWLVAGPFPAGALSGLEDSLDRDYLAASGLSPAGEASAAPLRVIGPGAKRWLEAETAAGTVDFLAALGPATWSVAYAYREITATEAHRVALRIGSDDGVKLWVNGELALARHARRSLAPGEDAVPIALAKGRNRILVKVSQAEGAWGFSLKLVPLEEEASSAAAARLTALAAWPDELAVPKGGILRGGLMSVPAFCAPGAATVELRSSSGQLLGSAAASLGGRFSLQAPPGFEGPAFLTARGSGSLAGLAAPASAIVVGNARALAASGAARARRAAASTAAPGTAAGIDASATLEFLATVLEGAVRPSLGGFGMSILALSEIEALAGPSPGAGTLPRPGSLARCAYRSTVDGSLQPFSLYLPSGYDRNKRYGLVVALHGAGGNDHEMASSLAAAKPADMLVVAPYGRGDLGYAAAGERDVLDVIALMLSRFAVDPDRVYLTGRSMGGFGAWRIGQLYPRKFAAIASFAGWTGLDRLENLSSTPLLAVHGDADGTVPIEAEARAVAILRSLGGDARLEALPGIGHDAFGAWTAREGPGRLFAWFRQHRRESWPAATKVRTTMARAGQGAWASILGLSRPLALAALDAEIVDSRHVRVSTENVAAFELDLRHPSLAKRGRILILADGVNLTADSLSAAARFEIGRGGRFAAALPTPPGTLLNGGSGFAALFDGPLRIVYGARKKSRAADNQAVAASIAGSLGDFGIIPDGDFDPASESASSLLLIGWPEENAVLARLASRLPLAIKGGKVSIAGESPAGSGFMLVMPNPEAPGRLVGILALPSRGAAAVDWARKLAASAGDEGTPDLRLLDREGAAIWEGCFDWSWSRLSRLAD